MLNTDQEYRLHIKEVGKYNLKDTYKWKEKATLFQERGYYTDYVEDTHDWLDFWEKEEEKILNGTYIDGWYIPGLYYFYLNYLPIFRKQDNIYDFPDVYDSDYHTYLCLEHAVFLNQDFCVIKKRQCLDKDTFINLPNGVDTIENLFLKNYRGEVFSLNENKELCIDKIKDIWLARKVTEVIRIVLAGGKTIECTEDHKIHTAQGWKKASELKLKDSLYTIEPPFGNISISENEAIVMGYFFSDGSYSQKNIAPKFTNVNKLYLDDFEKNLLLWQTNCSITKYVKGNGYDYVIINKEKHKGKENEFKRYLYNQGLCKKNENRTIPEKYMNLDKYSTSIMINRIFSGDGWLSLTYNKKSNSYRYEVGIGSMSLTFLHQLSYLLSKFKINCSIKAASTKKSKTPFYKLRIYKTTEVEVFLKTIGIYGKDNGVEIIKKYNNKENTFKIKKIERIKKVTTTYDLATENTQSFFANGIHVHNSGFSLKFCVPLIRELFFSRGSPNYIATYEEAQVLKAWSEIIEPYKEHLNTHTPWYRDLNPSKPLNWRTAKEVINESGRKLTVGRKNTLKGLVLSKSPSKGVGGCNLKGTLIKMADSSLMKVEDIRVGDFVVGKDGKPKKVLNLFSGISEMYEIHQSKAMSYVVTPNHQLHLYDQRKNKFVDIEAQDFYKLQPFSQTKLNGFKHDPIVYCEDKNLPIDPYFLGAFLGDGNKGKYSIVVNKTKDIEIYNYLKELCAKENLIFKETHRNISRPEYNDDMYDVWFKRNGTNSTSYHQKCRLLGLEIKHVPSIYLTSGITHRLQLLAGLIDTDGYYNTKRHRYELSIKCDILRKDITKLIEDLGFIVRTHKKTNNGKSSTVYNKETSIHVLHITGNIHTIPVKIKRKIAPNQLRKNSKGFSKLTIHKWGAGEYFGFECEDNLYSLEDGTITHNSAKWIFADESGVNPVLSTFKGYISPMIKYGNVKTGTLIISGAVGELKHLEGGLKEYITYPEKNGFYAVDNIWDKNNEFAGKKCGFFVPESWAYFGKDDDPESEYFGQPFIDEHGNSFVERATEYILKQRNGLVPNSIVEASKFDISQAPLTLSECFQYRGENVFPLELLNPQIERVERKEMHGTYIDLYEDQNKQIKKTILDKYSNRAILNHPIDPKSKNKEGVIQIWEMPPSIRPPYGVYWAGVDIVRDSESVNSPSLNCIHIYKGSHELEGEFKEKIIVAKYMSRPKDKMDWFNKAILLMEWYNAEALVENNVNWFIEEAIKIKKQHKIAKTPQWAKDLTPQGTSYLTKPYGVVMTPALLNKLLDAIAKYIKEPIFTEYNEEDGKPFIHYGVERIHDLQLLRELVNYKPKKEYEKGNYDSCFLKGTKITTPTGYKNIEDFKIGDYVINHKGLNDTVIETHKSYYKGDLYEITIPNQFNKIYCTEEHPILTSKRHYRTSGRWWNKFRNSMQDIGFKEAKNITKEDYIFLPKKKELKKNNNFSKEELYIMGWYVGDGHISEKNPNQLRIFLSMDQENIAKNIVNILNDLDKNRDRVTKEHYRNVKGKKILIKSRIERNKLKPAFYKKHKSKEYLIVYITSYELTKKIIKYCGKANNKFIHKDIFTDMNNLYFIAGLFSADGSLNNGRNYDGYSRFSCSLISTDKHIVEDVREMLFNNRILSNSRIQKIKKKNHKDQYQVTINNENINKLSNIYESFNNIISNKKIIRNVFIETDDGYWLKIKNIKKSYYEGYVYNIGVEKENTYIAENIAVHNCISFGLALLHAEFNEVRGITAKSVPEKPNFNKKNAKLLMRNRFSSRNFKLNK